MLAVSIHYYSAHVIAHLHIAPMWAILIVQTQCFSHLKMYASYCTALKGSIAALQLTCSWFIYSLGTYYLGNNAGTCQQISDLFYCIFKKV